MSSLCTYCAILIHDDSGFCSIHHGGEQEWAASNRIMCDWIHRGQVPARLSEPHRTDEAISDAAVNWA